MEDKEIKQLLKKDMNSFAAEANRTEWAAIQDKMSHRSKERPSEWLVSLISAITLMASLLLVFNSTIKEKLNLSESEIEKIEEFYFDETYLDENKDLYTWVE